MNNIDIKNSEIDEKRRKLVEAVNTLRDTDFKYSPKLIGSGSFENLSTAEINAGVHIMVDLLGLSGGSVGTNIDIYELLQAYLRKPDSRVELNKIVKKHLFGNSASN